MGSDRASSPGPSAVRDTPPRVGVAIPCWNEAAAIATVVAGFRDVLPTAEILVLDNNSTDGTGTIAFEAGAQVVHVPEQGKGCAVRRGFAELTDCDVVVLVDGDGTYPPAFAPSLIAAVVESGADMAVGCRQPVAQDGAMTPLRGFGNLVIRNAFRLLVGPGQGDLLSGYRAFSRRYRESARLWSTGFEIETELSGEAVARGLKVVEIPLPYYPRIAGTTSKLRAFRDGRRILWTILKLSARLRPWRLLLVLAVVLGASAVCVGSWPLGVLAGSVAGLAAALMTWPRFRRNPLSQGVSSRSLGNPTSRDLGQQA